MGTVFQEHLELPVGKGLQLYNTFDIDNYRAVYAKKAARVETLRQIS